MAQSRPRVPTVTTLGLLPSGTYTQPAGINQRGDVCGQADSSDTESRGVLYLKGKPTPKALPANASAELWSAGGLNDRGDACGYALSSTGGARAIFWKWKATAPVTLPTLAGGTEAAAGDVNSRGDVAGQSTRAGDEEFHGVIWDKRQQVFALPEPAEAEATAAFFISNSGVIVGYGSGNGDSRGLRWASRTAQAQILDTLVGDDSGMALAANNKGVAVGHSEAENGTRRAVIWAAGSTTATALPGVAGAVSTYATGVNDAGDIVGTASFDGAPSIAVYWPAGGGGPVNLNTYLPAGSNIRLFEARAINNKRSIVASGTEGSGSRGYLIKP
jgi:uncharacterized membrane protein